MVDTQVTPEGRVKAKVKRALKALIDGDYSVYSFMPVMNGMGAPSLDMLACINGHFVAIETKAPGKKMTPRQETTATQMRTAGALVLVVSDDLTLAIAMAKIRARCRVPANDDV